MTVPTYRLADIRIISAFQRSIYIVGYAIIDIVWERETSGESVGNSATIALLTQLIAIIRKSDGMNGVFILEQKRNSKLCLQLEVLLRLQE